MKLMIKTINVKKEMTFRELMEYILDNDIRDTHFDSENTKIIVGKFGGLKFDTCYYGTGEIYEVEVEEEITEDTDFECVVINTEHYIYSFRYISIKESRDKLPKAVEIFARIDGKLVKIWQKDD